MWQRLRQPVASSTSSVTWRSSSSAISAPWMARSPSPAAACANSIEPHRPSWSVSAKASYPSSTAAAASSSGSDAPSRKEKAEWAWSSTYTNTCSHTARMPSVLARRLPQVDAGVDRVPVDFLQLVGGEVELVQRPQAVLQLLDRTGADQRARDALVAQHPGDRHLRERLAAVLGDLVERADAGEVLLGEEVGGEEGALGGARVLGHAVEVLGGQHALAER